ncbi:MAG: Ig-like domain-containing protein [Deltaproteobacteria bacterium]|nr:Ig-like domain-containing protein [Deltaproteobacteria bacterium]
MKAARRAPFVVAVSWGAVLACTANPQGARPPSDLAPARDAGDRRGDGDPGGPAGDALSTDPASASDADGGCGVCDDADPCTDNLCDQGHCTFPDNGSCAPCSPVATPAAVDPDPLPGESPAGRHEVTTVNGFQDDYLYDNADYLKVGVRRDWGGSIIYYGLAGSSGPGVNAANTIDANDTGREVQVAFYDPDRAMQNCAWNAGCATTASDCPVSIAYLGWDPVQGGNRCNVGSGVDAVTFSGGVLSVTTRPLFWNPTWDRTDCVRDVCGDSALRRRRADVRVVQKLSFVKRHVVQLAYVLTNLAAVDHAPTNQEMPTVYTANGGGGTQDLWRMFDSAGTEISIDQPGNDGFFYKNFSSPGGFAMLQNGALNYGVGLYTENRLTSIQAWQNRSLPFNNFRPSFRFGLPASGVVRARSYLLIGSQATITAEAAWLDTHLPPFGTLDSPGADATLSGQANIAGWALDNIGVTAVSLAVDGTPVTGLTYGSARGDVCLVWPGYAGCPNVGFAGTLDTTRLSACQHLLEIRATDTDGNGRVIARRRVLVSR